MNKLIILAILLVTNVLFFIQNRFFNSTGLTKVHTLEVPMILSSDDSTPNMHLLPKGTTLYFDQSYPEGFTRYKVYINIDRTPLNLKDLSDPTTIIPIEARSIDKGDLKKLLQEYPITKNDLAAILKSGTLSKTEIKELLEEYSK